MPMGTERNVWIASEGSLFVQGDGIKKESPNEGTETLLCNFFLILRKQIKKESPNEGTETTRMILTYHVLAQIIKKESPNEGTETSTCPMASSLTPLP